ncbi:hypothetical protein [Chryseosolibacter indicus]|uniref:PKD domain-containing protein n=1 Tax=Chryseosolibacter indicus TaxID=2782351 RepID=A0ABS5VL50_9BACT|nr:hypothetical protein [Chryseosolibacter indicus]MBT1702177.1 hypothetical protein [Chryseosolibacter indicus]
MKNIKFLLLIILGVIAMTSCEDEAPGLGSELSASEIDFEVVQDYAKDPGGNTVILKNNTPGTVSIWDYGTGKSNRVQDTVHFAFKGDYVIKFSAVTRGGIVELDPVTVKVTEDNLNYVNDPLWTALSGGVGNSKTWILDNGEYGFATGPLSYADPSRKQLWGDYQINYEPADVGQTADDMASEMTFSLAGGPFLTTKKPNEGVNESGTYFLDANNHTLTTTNATIIRPKAFITNASNWTSNLNILELTGNQLRIAVYRTNNEGPWWYVLNYVSKEYAENYVPEDKPDPNFNHGNQGDILTVSHSKTWKLDLEVPYNWSDLSGKMLNNWSTRSDIMATGWAPYGDADVQNIDEASITFDANGTFIVKQDNGTTQTGTYVIDERKNLITFKDIMPSIPVAGWVSVTTTEENQWKIVKVERNEVNDVVTGIWFGKRDPAKDEYMVFHFVQR